MERTWAADAKTRSECENLPVVAHLFFWWIMNANCNTLIKPSEEGNFAILRPNKRAIKISRHAALLMIGECRTLSSTNIQNDQKKLDYIASVLDTLDDDSPLNIFLLWKLSEECEEVWNDVVILTRRVLRERWNSWDFNCVSLLSQEFKESLTHAIFKLHRAQRGLKRGRGRHRDRKITE